MLALVAVLGGSAPVATQEPEPSGGGGSARCVAATHPAPNEPFSAVPSALDVLGQSTTLRWNLLVPAGCVMSFSIVEADIFTSKRATLGVTPPAYGTHTYTLQARSGSYSRSWKTTVRVALPRDGYGRINVTIYQNDQVDLFVAAISSNDAVNNSTDAIVHLRDGVNLNLSLKGTIHIMPGVQILGGRSLHNPGPSVFTTNYPNPMFMIGQYWNADNVRISGIRILGADGSVAEESTPNSIGILVASSINVEIANNEISGWHVAGVQVEDPRARIDRNNGMGAVRIRRNSIHRNQRIGEGYGVEVTAGAYALIEKNVFDDNRHAIAGGGHHGTGYFAYRNLVLTDGGHHEWYGIDSRTHQIDMHGQSDCWGFPHYCGTAGEYMDIRHNTIAYTAGAAIKIRGEPTLGLDVARNVFSHSQVWGGYIDDAALVQTEGNNLRQRENRFGQTLPNAVWVCPFEEPGLPSLPPVPEGFLATGETWWIAGSWGIRYLNSSTKMIEDVVLGDTDGDRRCDVSADGLVSRGGRTPLKAPARTDIVWRESNTGRLRVSLLQGAVSVGDTYPVTFAPHRRILGTGDFDGDGDHDILSRVETGQALEETFISFMQDGAVVSEHSPGFTSIGMQVKGIADFDGDDAADILWRYDDGQLALWIHEGTAIHATLSWRNAGGIVGSDWQIQGTGDFNGDGYADIVWRHNTGLVSIWLMVGTVYTGEFYPGVQDPNLSLWTIQGIGDFDSDGRSDILWRHDDGRLAMWFQGSDLLAAYPSWSNSGAVTDSTWQVQGVSDFNADGRSDIVWRHESGQVAIWMMNGGTFTSATSPMTVDAGWTLQGLLPRFSTGW